MTPPSTGGLVALRPGVSARDYPLFGEDAPSRCSAVPGAGASAATRGSLRQVDVNDSAVARLFLSPCNINALQDGLRYRVCQASLEAGAAPPGYIIGRQNDVELGIVMRGMYQQYSRNLPINVVDQVRDLNAKVLDFCTPKVLQEAMSYRQYRVDISSSRPVMVYGQVAGTKGSRQLGDSLRV